MKVPYFIKKLLMCSVPAASAVIAAMSVPSAWAAGASGNDVTYSGEDKVVTGDVWGGSSYSDPVENNKLTVSDKANVTGAVDGGLSFNGTVENNHVTISNEAQVTGGVSGGFSLNGSAMNNYVTITNGATVNANTAGIAGGYVSEFGGGAATGNHLTISGGAKITTIFVWGGYSCDNNATHNSVTLDGAVFTSAAEVWGGYSTSSSAATTHNTVTLLSGDYSNVTISGGNQADVTGNKLVLNNFTGKLGTIKNFEEICIITSLSNTASGEPDSDTTWTLPENVKVSVELAQGGADNEPLKISSKMTLLRGLPTRPNLEAIDTSSLTGRGRSAFFVYDLNLGIEERIVGDATAYDVVVTLANMGLTEQTKALSEARVAAMQLNYRAGDLVTAQGMGQAKQAAQGRKGLATFFAMSAGHDKVDSGSHVDVDGLATMLGVSGSLTSKKALTIGAFVESGWGNYTTHNSFADGNVRGTGESSYVGGGILLGYELKHASKKLKGISLDASLRAGQQETDFSTADMPGADSPVIGYESTASYISGHAGVNYRFSPSEKLAAQAYARYMWSRLGGDNAEISGEQVDFEAMSSNRLQFGMRAEYKLGEHWTPHAGLAYEWECSGNAHARIQELGVAAPSMRGGSLSGELGASWQPNLNRPLWLNGGVQGVVGKREGYGANVGCTIAF